MDELKNTGHQIHWAASYDLLLNLLTFGGEGRFRQRIVDAAQFCAGNRVLDVGCGMGTLAIETAAAVGREGSVTGIDPSPEMVARARSKADARGVDVRFCEVGIEALPFAGGSFDSVVSSLMFHHLDADLKIRGLGEILRVLVPGGRLTIIDFADVKLDGDLGFINASEDEYRPARRGARDPTVLPGRWQPSRRIHGDCHRVR
ncbi:MAG: class I SAM-dependent methyltransferase [Pseudomonadales bacterium]|nr:class I SAM-dependent methyltransferase [Pseudomonadales bacterium]MDP6472260.1 class I SAM-dependent methyltransferase [Pseudomonadales bacterium]MDP6826488.1 class I SAM-dependent methyltransferase [Pseudomonadales bacterium]MDP6970673.1 class I SAM-dependent methyltransferase [Pseudomonadales bacterium]